MIIANYEALDNNDVLHEKRKEICTPTPTIIAIEFEYLQVPT